MKVEKKSRIRISVDLEEAGQLRAILSLVEKCPMAYDLIEMLSHYDDESYVAEINEELDGVFVSRVVEV